VESRAAARDGGQPSKVPTPDPQTWTPAALLALQASAGNRAVQLLMRQGDPPSRKQIETLWEREWTEAMPDEECTDVARRMARRLGGVKRDAGTPVIRFSTHDKDATPQEVAEAHSRSKKNHKKKYLDRVLPNTDTLFVHSGSAADGKDPIRTEFQLLPGMLIYTAEDGGYKNKKAGTYRWFWRNMMMYAGDGFVYENWVPADDPRNLWTADDDHGVHPSSDKFVVVLSIYDPFKEHRAALFKRQLNEAFHHVKGGAERTLEKLIPWR